MSEFEKNVTHYEQLAKKIIAADKKLQQQEKQLSKRGGIYSDTNGPSLPSAFVRKQQKQNNLGLFGGRLDDSTSVDPSEKIRSESEKQKLNPVEALLFSLGVKTYKLEKLAKGSLVSGAGAPIQKNNAFKNLVTKVNRLTVAQRATATILSQGQSFVSGASRLTSVAGITGLLGTVASRIPHVAAIILVATAVTKAYLAQFKAGGTRDKRKKVKAEDVSLIGVDNENVIASGTNLFLSNPQILQGLPRGNSNTIHLRDGIVRYKQRHQGDYS